MVSLGSVGLLGQKTKVEAAILVVQVGGGELLVNMTEVRMEARVGLVGPRDQKTKVEMTALVVQVGGGELLIKVTAVKMEARVDLVGLGGQRMVVEKQARLVVQTGVGDTNQHHGNLSGQKGK